METSGSIFRVYPIDMGLFFTVSDEELLCQVHDQFPQELDRLQRAYSILDRGIVRPSIPSPSHILYGTEHDEVNRTLVSVLSLRWIYRDQYETFTGTQPGQVALSRSSFNWIRSNFMERLKEPMDLYALLVYIVINDLGKDPQLASDYQSKKQEDISVLNHDIILYKSVAVGLVPCIDSLPQEYKDKIIRGMRIGAEFNPGQLAQAENAPASLSILLEMKGYQEDFTFHFLQQLLDISGAAGHEDWTCAKKLIQPIVTAYQNVYEVALGIISGDQGSREAYDEVITRRSSSLHKMGFRVLAVQRPEHRALMRLLCMGGVSNLEDAELYCSAWEDLDDSTRGSLVHSLNIDGSLVEPAIQPTYMPAMLTQGLGQASSGSRRDKIRCLRYMLRYLSRVMTFKEERHGYAVVIERSVLWVVKEVVQSSKFQEDPTILENTDVPEGAVAIPTRKNEEWVDQ